MIKDPNRDVAEVWEKLDQSLSVFKRCMTSESIEQTVERVTRFFVAYYVYEALENRVSDRDALYKICRKWID